MTIDEQLAKVNAALDRCNAQTRANGELRWTIAFCVLLGVKARLILSPLPGERK